MRHGRQLVKLLSLLLLVGCTRAWRTPKDLLPFTMDQRIVEKLQVFSLAKDRKTRMEVHGWQQRSDHYEFRWTHDALEDLLDSPLRQRLSGALGSSSPHVEATATIGLARLTPNQYGKELADIVRSSEHHSFVRCAAAEMLGVNKSSGQLHLERLLDRLWKLDGEKLPAGYDRRLHGELLRSYGRFTSPSNDKRFDQIWHIPLPAESQGPPYLRLALVDAWERSGDTDLGDELLDLLDSANHRLRIAVLNLIGRTNNQDFVAETAHALDDRHTPVAVAAAHALGRLKGSQSAVVHLRDKVSRGPLPVRVAAIKAIAAQGEWSVVAAQLQDSNWQVRQAVASTLSAMPAARAERVATKLANDKSTEVVKEALKAIRQWPLQKSATVYFAALQSDAYLIRKAASRAFGSRWKDARRFPAASARRTREGALQRLKQRWLKDHGKLAKDESKKSDKPSRGGPLSAIDRGKERELVYALEDAEETEERLSVLKQIARLLDKQTAQLATAQEVQRVLKYEKAASAWTTGLQILEGQPWPAISPTWTRAQGHKSAEVRSVAARFLGNYALTAPDELWSDLLHDRDSQVVIAALGGIRDNDFPAPQRSSIKSLMQHNDYNVRVAAAACLAKHGEVSGTAALERFAVDDDPRIRRLAARQFGQIGDKQHITMLIEMLDDESSVSLLALDSLTQIVGDKAPNFAGDTQSQRIRRWKRWHRKRQTNRTREVER